MACFKKLVLSGCALAAYSSALSIWGGDLKPSSILARRGRGAVTSPTEAQTIESRLPRIYEVALRELEELESEPFCHRIAARLLVTNCHLLEGKDDASLLTDGGRQIRDFVDSYAASLAICDLERGSFVIPGECSPFQEATLSQLPVQDQPRLHVGPKQIEDCLTGLARSDSAWSTWVSYRHKAVRFCEAARADNEKSQSILLYQRLAKVIGKLADGVEAELQKRMDSLDLHARQVTEAMESLTPQVDELRQGLTGVQDFLTKELHAALHQSATSVREGFENAAHLQQLITVLLKTVMDGNSQVASAQEQSLERVTLKASDGMAVFVNAMAAAVASSASLQNEIELSRLQATGLTHRQEVLEQGMSRLLGLTERFSIHQGSQNYMLAQAQNMTNNILDTLESTATSAAGIKGSLSRDDGVSSWWPLLVCPTASLVMGSYGLPPSAVRNLGLVTLGWVLGLVISFWNRLDGDFAHFLWAWETVNLETANAVVNLTAVTA